MEQQAVEALRPHSREALARFSILQLFESVIQQRRMRNIGFVSEPLNSSDSITFLAQLADARGIGAQLAVCVQ